MSRLAWTDPAPLEVERPRLPWWTMLPRKLLLAASPVIVVVVLVVVLVFLARRAWRYPLFLIGGTIMAGLGVGSSWWVPVWLAAGLAVAAGLWSWAHPDSFERIAVRQVRSEWRRALVYTWPWKRVMLIDHLSVQKWITKLGTGRAPATVAEAHRLTSAVLRSAVRNRLIAFNPCEGIRLPRRRRGDTAEQVISREELRSKLLPTAPERYRAISATAAVTGLRWGEATGLRLDALDLNRARLSVIRTVIEVGGHTSFKPYPKSSAGRRTLPLPGWLVPIIREHLDQYPGPADAPIYANAVGKPLRRTLFRSRVWRPLLVKVGMLGALTVINDNTVRASWTDNTGATLAREFITEREAVLHIAKSCAGGLRFHDLRH